MRKKKNIKILAIDPGTRNIGFALLDKSMLVHSGVKTIFSTKPQEKLKYGKKIILRLINDFQPDILAVEKTFFGNNKHSKLLNTFTKQIRIIGKQKGLKVLNIATNSVRKAICGNGAASKDEVAIAVVYRFPELHPFLISNRRWKEEYFRNMFDAVALGMIVDRIK